MGKSYRKTPISGITTAKSEKNDKRWANRRERHVIDSMLHVFDPEGAVLPARKEVSNPWDMAKDGKLYLGKDADRKWLRK